MYYLSRVSAFEPDTRATPFRSTAIVSWPLNVADVEQSNKLNRHELHMREAAIHVIATKDIHKLYIVSNRKSLETI